MSIQRESNEKKNIAAIKEAMLQEIKDNSNAAL